MGHFDPFSISLFIHHAGCLSSINGPFSSIFQFTVYSSCLSSINGPFSSIFQFAIYSSCLSSINGPFSCFFQFAIYSSCGMFIIYKWAMFIHFPVHCLFIMFMPTDSLPSHKSTSDSLGWGGVGWGGIIASLAFPHEPDATLYDLQLQFHMNLMLRSMIFNCNSTHPHPIVWGGVGWGGIITSLAFPHELDATLFDLHWHFHMILMLRSMIFIGISTWSWCYALWSSSAFPHDLDATLYDLHWHFHMILMLRSMIFIGISTWSWCYALWSSLAFPHELDAKFYDLQCEKSCGYRFWGWSDGRVVIPKVDGPFFWIGFECKNWLLAVRM